MPARGNEARRHGRRKRLDFQIDAGDIAAAFLGVAARALAEFGETHVAVLVQLQAGGDEHAVDIEACLALEFEQHAHHAGVAGAAAEDPAAAAKDAAGECFHQARGLFGRNRFHFQRPGNVLRTVPNPALPR